LSFQFDKRHFANARPLPTFVLVDLCRHRLANRRGLGHGDVAGVLARCRIALVHAREVGLAVAFVRDARRVKNEPGMDWIKGFEPRRDDMVFERRSPSCYANPYFGESASAAGTLVVAGFLGDGGCLSTAADAIRARNGITFLEDATIDAASARTLGEMSLAQLNAFTNFEIYATGTRQWIASMGAAGNQRVDVAG
jgi:nicotinamidase-related amidase